mgnify:CR=1 FL=1
MPSEVEARPCALVHTSSDSQILQHNISRSLQQSLIEGFMEDKHIIEAQQTLHDEDPDFQMLAVAADAPLSHFRWTLDKLIRQEREREVAASGAGVRKPMPGLANAAGA